MGERPLPRQTAWLVRGQRGPARAGLEGDDSWGVNFLDADHDGDEDLFVVTMAGSRIDLFFSNDGDGTFRNVARQAGVRIPDGRGSAIADYDRDGDMDVAVVNQDGPLQLFRNDHRPAGWGAAARPGRHRQQTAARSAP